MKSSDRTTLYDMVETVTCLQVLPKSLIVAAESFTDFEFACGVQVACILLPLCFLYDIFWVFITPLIMGGKSVMVEVSILVF